MKKIRHNETQIEDISEPRYLLAERQLSSIPLWEPKKKPGKGPVIREKDVSFSTSVKGQPVKIHLKIKSAGNDGFPNTTDLDIFRAIEQLATEVIQTQPTESDSLSFKGYEILTAAGKSHTGYSYKELRRCLSKLHGVSFELLGRDGKKERLLRFNLFESVYEEGQKKPDGTVAELIEIKFASWYWKSLRGGNCLVIDHALFQRLRLSLSKLLHQFLHAQFYMHHGAAMEKYEELAKNWGMKEHTRLGKIKEQLDPSHEELRRLGFLESWAYHAFNRAGKKSFQISWKAGSQWHELLEVQKLHLGVEREQGGDHLLFLKEPEEDDEGHEALLVQILEVVGASDKKYLPFWKQAIRDLPRSVISKQMGDLRERIADGEKIRNKGAYLMKLFRVEAKKRELPWAEGK